MNISNRPAAVSSIRHVCCGHEFRYHGASGEVFNNYGRPVAVVRFEAYTPKDTPYVATLYAVSTHWPKLYTSDQVAVSRDLLPSDIPALAAWAISHAAMIPGAK
jgi:hypothetical protein